MNRRCGTVVFLRGENFFFGGKEHFCHLDTDCAENVEGGKNEKHVIGAKNFFVTVQFEMSV